MIFWDRNLAALGSLGDTQLVTELLWRRGSKVGLLTCLAPWRDTWKAELFYVVSELLHVVFPLRILVW